jgi:hypothetical protein
MSDAFLSEFRDDIFRKIFSLDSAYQFNRSAEDFGKLPDIRQYLLRLLRAIQWYD